MSLTRGMVRFFQPYRTNPLVLPGAKVKRDQPKTESYLRHHPNPMMRAHPLHFDQPMDTLMKQKVSDPGRYTMVAMSHSWYYSRMCTIFFDTHIYCQVTNTVLQRISNEEAKTKPGRQVRDIYIYTVIVSVSSGFCYTSCEKHLKQINIVYFVLKI